MAVPGADDLVGRARHREQVRGGEDHESADRIRAAIRGVGWERRNRPGGTELVPVAETIRPIRR